MTTYRKSIVTMAALLLLLLPSCKEDGDVVYMLPEVKPVQLTEEQKLMRDDNNEFAWRLFQTMQQEQGSTNTVLSPISVTYMLGMLDAGAAGTTRDEITQALGFGEQPEAVHEFCKKLIEEAPNVDPAATVKMANCIDVNSALGLNLLKEYVNEMKTYYHAQVDALDFTKSSTLNEINNWCNNNTQGMIPSILDQINPNAAMYLISAIYFNAEWREKFDVNDTRNSSFTRADGTTVNLPLMHRRAVALGCESELGSMLCIPFGSAYSSGGYRMYVMMPAEGKTLGGLIGEMSMDELNRHLSAIDMAPHEVDILMPRFEIASDINLVDLLKSMGIKSAFSPQSANFSNMCSTGLFVSMMKQKAKIEVNEDGAKASAVTISSMDVMADAPQQYVKAEFHATRPFLYFILEESSRTIFFIGTYCGD